MSGFNQESAMSETPQGESEIPAVANAQTVTGEGAEEHEVGAAGGLPWYFANKFEYRNNKSGVGRHLAPQDSYVADVLAESVAQATRFVPEEKSSEFDALQAFVSTKLAAIETLNSFDIDDDAEKAITMEAAAELRALRTRYLLALKIAGANHVDRMYRIRHAQLNDWDINRTTENQNFIMSGNIRDKWARKAGFYQAAIDMLKSEYEAAQIDLNLEGGIRQSLYQDARDVSNNLSAPKPVVAPGEDIDKAALSTLAA